MDQIKNIIKAILAILLVLSIDINAHELAKSSGQTIRVGVWNNPPVVFQDKNGQWQGITIDILEFIAKKNNWQLEYVSDSFANHVENLNQHKIDLLSAIAYSEARAKKYSYTKESIIGNWAVIYTRTNANIGSLLDLNNKTVAVMRNNIHYDAFRKLTKRFQLKINIKQENSFADVMKSVSSGAADAGVSNRLFGALNAGKFRVVETGIIFNPINIHYAAPHEGHRHILDEIDNELGLLKSEHNSLYYSSLGKWLNPDKKSIIPNWLYTVAIIFSLILVLMSTLAWVLKRQVALRTRELQIEVEERRSAQTRLDQLAYYDALTGLPNRVSFAENLKKILAHAKRHNSTVAVLFIDLDEFKDINDSLGHDSGDKLIINVAERLKSCLREEDHINRFGGDEFVAVLPDIRNISDINNLAERMLDCLREPIDIGIREIYTTASIGISTYPNDATDSDGLLQFADAAMYHAKSLGGDKYQFYNSTFTEHLRRRLSLESRLRYAIKRDELSIHYQPILDLNNQKAIGVEALMRWDDPEEGKIFPDEFIPLAEETGLIVPLGEWILNRACHQIKQWEEEGLGTFMLSVNVSTRQFMHAEFHQQVMNAIFSSKIVPDQLELEITERMFLNINNQVRDTLDRLKDTGIRLSIDDFGTGYSSLSYLKQLPIDTLKIDRSFVKNIPHDLDDIRISSTIISMAHSLGLDVVAEGIETNEQLEFLVEHGCGRGQGYYFAKPQDAQNIQNWLQNKQIK